MSLLKWKLNANIINTLAIAWVGIGIFSLFASIIIASKLIFSLGLTGLSDFDNYNTGGRMILGAEKELYSVGTQSTYQAESIKQRNGLLLPFRSPPLIAALFSVFASFDIRESYIIFYCFNLAIFLISAFLIYKFLIRSDWKPLVFYLFFWSVWANLSQGQLSLLFLVFFLLIYRMLEKKGENGAGAACSLLTLKPQLLVALPFLLLTSRDKIRFLKYLMVGSLLIYLTSSLLTEPGWIFSYVEFLFSTEKGGFGSYKTGYSTLTSFIYSIFQRQPAIPDVVVYGINFVVYGIILHVFSGRLKNLSFKQAFASVILLSLPFSVHLYNHDLVYVIIPFYLILGNANTKDMGGWLIRTVMLVGIFLAPLIAIINSVVVFVIIFASGLYLLFTDRFKWSA